MKVREKKPKNDKSSSEKASFSGEKNEEENKDQFSKKEKHDEKSFLVKESDIESNKNSTSNSLPKHQNRNPSMADPNFKERKNDSNEHSHLESPENEPDLAIGKQKKVNIKQRNKKEPEKTCTPESKEESESVDLKVFITLIILFFTFLPLFFVMNDDLFKTGTGFIIFMLTFAFGFCCLIYFGNRVDGSSGEVE